MFSHFDTIPAVTDSQLATQTDRHVAVASTRYAIASRLKNSGKPSGGRASIPNPFGGAHSTLQTSQRTSPLPPLGLRLFDLAPPQ